jgi:ABC-type dipeptide/oligopeptide/nickel transport system permease component
MKKYSAIITIIIFILIVFYLFVLPKIKSNNYSLNAIVISISPESKRSGKSEIQLKQESTSRYIYYTFLDNAPDITVGDSLIKSLNSKILFVKSKKDGALREARDQDYLLGP